MRGKTIQGVDMDKVLDIPWIFAMTKGRVYEDGLPHTRENIIFLTTDLFASLDSLANTLLHEKVHVYQRMYPELVDQWLNDHRYASWKLIKDVPMTRANPDVNEWIYIDPVSKKPMMTKYSSANPSGISDVTTSNPAFEHPFEYMAYDIANRLPSKPNSPQ